MAALLNGGSIKMRPILATTALQGSASQFLKLLEVHILPDRHEVGGPMAGILQVG
jgi:hypothetical protein